MKPLSVCKVLLFLYMILGNQLVAICQEQNVQMLDHDALEQYRVECTDKINSFRISEGKTALKRWKAKELCTDRSARKEFEEAGVHISFQDCGELAQNLCPGYESFDHIVNGCIPQMWDEGPGEPYSKHGHYINMSNIKYTKVACGFYTDLEGKVWHIQNFR